MTILAIETSCDDTCISIIKIKNQKSKIKNFDILSNIVSSQVEIHKKYGGVYPTLAKREHQRNLLPVLIRALRQSKLLKISKSKFLISKQVPNSKFQKLKKILEREKNLFKYLKNFLINYRKPKVDLIAVTIGPGLEPCLWVGVNFAKALAYFWNLPVVPVSHIEAHIMANWLKPICQYQKSYVKCQIFPAICLVVSGGHTQLILMKNIGKYKILGETRDDAAGECFDKTAKILGLEYPGGPAIAANAANLKSQKSKVKIRLPRPMIYSKDYDFSFSGLKTAVLYKVKSQKSNLPGLAKQSGAGKSQKFIRKMAYEIQQTIIDVLIHKTIKAAENFKAKTIILGGGVAANQELRRQFKQRLKKDIPDSCFLIPDSKLCTDNATMAGVAGYFGWLKGEIKNWRGIKAEANLRLD